MNNIQKKFNSVLQSNKIFNLIDADYKQRLHDELFEEQIFYLNVVNYFSESFGICNQNIIIEMSLAYYSFYKGIMQLDCLLDADNLSPKERLYRYVTSEILFNNANGIYQNIFPADNIFWTKYNFILKEYYSSYFITLSDNPNISESEYYELAIKKNYPAIIPVLALASYSNNFEFFSSIKNSLLDLHCSMQYYDDVVDFKKDLIENNITYPHLLVSRYLSENNLDPGKMDAAETYKYFHVSKISLTMLKLAESKLTNSLDIISELNLSLYKNDIGNRLRELENLIRFFEEKLKNGNRYDECQ